MYFNAKEYYGEGYLTPDGKFVLKAGAKICPHETKSYYVSISKRRQSAVDSVLLKNWITTEDMVFTSTSAAGTFISGFAINGLSIWKNIDGV